MSDTFNAGDFIRLNDAFDWGNGKFAGQVVQIVIVQDNREAANDVDALIYEAQIVDQRDDAVLMGGIPVLPGDVDERYDHYEARRAADFNRLLNSVIS